MFREKQDKGKLSERDRKMMASHRAGDAYRDAHQPPETKHRPLKPGEQTKRGADNFEQSQFVGKTIEQMNPDASTMPGDSDTMIRGNLTGAESMPSDIFTDNSGDVRGSRNLDNIIPIDNNRPMELEPIQDQVAQINNLGEDLPVAIGKEIEKPAKKKAA